MSTLRVRNVAVLFYYTEAYGSKLAAFLILFGSTFVANLHNQLSNSSMMDKCIALLISTKQKLSLVAALAVA